MIKRLFLNDSFILFLVIVNSITIMLGGFDNLDELLYRAIFITDNTITTLFLVELIIKFRFIGIPKYFKSNWNRLDFILIVLSIPALISWIFNYDLSSLSFFLVFRVLRVFKSFRFLKFVPGISDLIKGVKRALKTSVVIILGFAVFTFIIGILSCYLFKNACPEYFSDPFIAFYSTFKIFTMEGWTEIPDLIALNSSDIIGSLSRLYFVLVVISGGIFGLSLVNSIFVDAMLSDNTDDIAEKVDTLDKKIDLLLKNMPK